jgi:hypothetical protein
MTGVICKHCGDAMTMQETVVAPNQGPTIEMYLCARDDRKAAVVYEPEGGLDEQAQSWVEREIARRGSFFPSDFSQQNTGPRR